MPSWLANELDNMKYDSIKEKLRNKAAVTAIRMYKQEPNKFPTLYKIEAKPEKVCLRCRRVSCKCIDPETGQRWLAGYQDVLKIVRIRDAEVLYEGRVKDNKDETLEIYSDFRRDERSYEQVCTRIFVQIAKEENEDLDGLVQMFEKLFKGSRGRMSRKCKELLGSETGHAALQEQETKHPELEGEQGPPAEEGSGGG